MADDMTNTGDADGQRIDIHQEDDVRDWAAKFSVTHDQIMEAVQAVGPLAADVEMHLKGSRATTNAEQEARTEPHPGH